MVTRREKTLLRAMVLLGVLGAPSGAFAAGFAVAEQGAASQGVAGAATARTDLPEAGFYNPAASSLAPGLQSALGASAILPSLRHRAPDGTTTRAEPGAETPPYAYAAYGFGLGERHVLSAGLSFNVPFGAGLSWPSDWEGRYEVTHIGLRVFELAPHLGFGTVVAESPTMAYRLRLAAAVGPRLMRSSVELTRAIDAVDTQGEVELGGVAQGVGIGASLVARLFLSGTGTLSFGANVRPPTALTFEGLAHFENVPVELSGAAHDQRVTTEVTLPGRYALGAAYDFGRGAASIDAEYFGWRSFETFGIDFESEETPDVMEAREWRDTVALRAGYEHRLLRHRRLRLRTGVAWDPTPSPPHTLSPTLPDSDRIVLTAGAGYRFGFGLGLDVSYGHVVLMEHTATGEEAFPGTYAGSAEIVSFGISYR